MATPHVAGTIALYLETHQGASPATVTQAIVIASTIGLVTNPGSGSPNRLLYSLLGGSPSDSTPPTTSITSPGSGATVSGTTTVQANASDSGGVTRVELFVDGSLAGTDTMSPYSFAWSTTSVGDGSHGLQTRAYDGAGNVGFSDIVNVTVANGGGGGGGGGGELIVNGGFEGSSSPWSFSGNAYWSTGGNQHSGSGYSVLGFYDNANGTMYQTVAIPAGAAGSYSFWLNVTTSESGFVVYDRLFVEVRSTSGALLATLATYSNVNAGAYSPKTFSLAAWRGQTVRLQFRATTDVSLPTSFRVDDVSVT